MGNKHTPGPWEVLPEEPDKDYIRVRGTVLGGKYKIADIPFVRSAVWVYDLEEARKNAKLVADCPELLDTMRLLLRSFEAYMAETKPEENWDEYDFMMHPVWKRAKILVEKHS